MVKMTEQARIINAEIKKQRFLEKESQRIVKLPNHVWEKVQRYIKDEFGISITRKAFSFEYFLYRSGKFSYPDFANKISTVKARVMFSVLARKLGIGIIKDTDGSYGFVALDHLDAEGMEALFETYKNSSRYEITPAGEENKATKNVTSLD